MLSFLPTIPDIFHQGPPSPAIPGVNASVDVNAGQPQTTMGQVGQGIGDAFGGIANEGLAGLLDPVGMMDRARAARELQSKFSVVDDDFQGERLPNQVSAAEYETIVRQYSDIRLGRSDLKIDTSKAADPTQYKADMMDDIGDIMQTAAGRQLIGQLGNNQMIDASGTAVHRTTTLQPHFKNGVLDYSNAFESGDSSAGVGSPSAPGVAGVGGDTTIDYNPNHDIVGGGGTYRSDVVLFHEMVHALHDTRGTTDTSMVGATDNVQRDLMRGNVPGAINELVNPDPRIAGDVAAGIARYEHQAVGLGVHSDDPLTENRYRAERNRVAQSGKGLSGDLLMEQRDRYAGYSGTYNDFFGM